MSRRCIMDYSRILLVPFHATVLAVVAIFAILISFFTSAGVPGAFAILFIQVWVFKYCYVIVESLADGAPEPPVMDTDMLSPTEIRPWIQAAIVGAGIWLCYPFASTRSIMLGAGLLLMFPATVAILGFGERAYQAVNPLVWYRVIRGLGPYYLLLLALLGAWAGVFMLLERTSLWMVIKIAILLWCQIAFFSTVGVCIYLRRRQLGYEPSRTPERAAARAEAERQKVRAKMVDDVFQLVRIGRHVDATEPLAQWLRDSDAAHVSHDAYHVAEQAVRWQSPAALNPIGSTLIRHLMRFGRPDAALAVFEILRRHAPAFTMDSAHDLRTLAEYADGAGHTELAQSMRLETPVLQPRT